MKRARLLLALATVSIAFSLEIQAQDDPVGQSIGVTPAVGSVPPWHEPSLSARQDLGDFIRKANSAVLVVGTPQIGHGTAWVVSREHRLLATNAHVADIMHKAGGKMFAIVNGTATVYRVEHVWYHPGLRRIVGGTVIKSTDPSEGEVFPDSPDLAILQLASDGPELPTELKMAGPEHFPSLLARPVAMFGYPGYDTSWPQIGENAEATYHDGVISRFTNFQNSISAPLAERQFVQHTMGTWVGFSGSPIFLPSGEVICINNSAHIEKDDGSGVRQYIPYGIRIDCLWELIAHHGLDDKIPLPVDKSQLSIQRWLEEDPAALALRQAMALVSEASDLIYKQEKFSEGVAKCKEAAKLAPNYAEIYNVRCDGYLNYWFKRRREIDPNAAFKQLQYAEQDALKFAQLNPTDPWAFINLALVYNNAGQQLDNDDLNRQALQLISQLLESDNLPNRVRAAAHSNRAIALDNLDSDDAALQDHNEAIRVDPKNAQWYENRADFWRYQGRGDLESQDYETARRLRQGS